jgi:hypothetical protein
MKLTALLSLFAVLMLFSTCATAPSGVAGAASLRNPPTAAELAETLEWYTAWKMWGLTLSHLEGAADLSDTFSGALEPLSLPAGGRLFVMAGSGTVDADAVAAQATAEPESARVFPSPRDAATALLRRLGASSPLSGGSPARFLEFKWERSEEILKVWVWEIPAAKTGAESSVLSLRRIGRRFDFAIARWRDGKPPYRLALLLSERGPLP